MFPFMSLAGFLHVKMGVNIKFITLPQGTLSPNMDSNKPPTLPQHPLFLSRTQNNNMNEKMTCVACTNS